MDGCFLGTDGRQLKALVSVGVAGSETEHDDEDDDADGDAADRHAQRGVSKLTCTPRITHCYAARHNYIHSHTHNGPMTPPYRCSLCKTKVSTVRKSIRIHVRMFRSVFQCMGLAYVIGGRKLITRSHGSVSESVVRTTIKVNGKG